MTAPRVPPEAFRRAAIAATVRRCALFADLPAETIGQVAECCELRRVEKGEALFREGDPAAGFFVVHTGAINVHRLAPDGREQVIRIFYPAESFAETALIPGSGYPAGATAVEESQVLLVRREPFRGLIRADPDFALRILASMSLHLKYLVQMLEDLKFKQAESRLANWLLRQAAAQQEVNGPGAGIAVELPVAKRLLASQLGVASETFSRVLAKFRDEGAIEVEGATIRLRDPLRLQAAIES